MSSARTDVSRVDTASARDFIAKWGSRGRAYALSERAGAQAHFIGRCRLLVLNPERSAL